MKHVNILGVPFSITDQSMLIDYIEHHIENKEKSFIITANPEIVMRANDDWDYMKNLQRATYITADGIGIVKASRILGQTVPERVTGYDVMMELLRVSDVKKYKIYLLGAEQDTLQAAKTNIQLLYPHIEVVGSHDGYFNWNENTITEEIKKVQPDLIFVALGAPKQEKWIAEHIDQFDHGVFICVGGSFDVVAGKVKRAPLSWQNKNLEWLYRLLKQPSRWRRMLALPRFTYHVIKQKVRNRHE
ncbi:WecB/TagA/CpsF family glycosyltransferase [Halobacillus trueperi]|uniref:WecB/TagA/CpsF family glycosyltransferase n=1 Tax=Halobacillus trueperi TaxID=156205 RepID=UPI003735E6BE